MEHLKGLKVFGDVGYSPQSVSPVLHFVYCAVLFVVVDAILQESQRTILPLNTV